MGGWGKSRLKTILALLMLKLGLSLAKNTYSYYDNSSNSHCKKVDYPKFKTLFRIQILVKYLLTEKRNK